MNKEINIEGHRYGKLKAVRKLGIDKWEFACECGNTISANKGNVTSGKTKSCGCYRKEQTTKHGKHGRPIYNTWHSMVQRCNNPKATGFHNYGGRGIEITDKRWLTFENFLKDMGERPINKTLDRVNNDLGYCKENCRWVSWSQQIKNRRQRTINKSKTCKACGKDEVSFSINNLGRQQRRCRNCVRLNMQKHRQIKKLNAYYKAI